MSRIDGWQVLGLLTSLVDKSLVVYEEDEAGLGGGRYRLLETVRQYAAERLAGGGEAGAVRGRHRDHFLALAGEAAGKSSGPGQGLWLDRLEADHDNLRAALDFCQAEPGGAEAGLRLAAGLYRFWKARGHWSEGRERLAALLALPGAQDPTRGHAVAIHRAGVLAYMQDDYEAARSQYEEGLALSQELGDKKGVAYSLTGLGEVANARGDLAAARSLLEEALALFRQLGDKRGVAASLIDLGGLAWGRGDYAAARSLLEESQALSRERGDRWAVANSLGHLGLVAHWQGDFAAARSLHEEALALWREMGDRWGVAAALGNLGFLLGRAEDYAGARACLAESLTLCRGLEDRYQSAWDLETCADLSGRQGRPWRAARLYGAARALREAIGCPLPPNRREEVESSLAGLESALGPAAFAAALTEGRAMTWEQAVEYAVAEDDRQ